MSKSILLILGLSAMLLFSACTTPGGRAAATVCQDSVIAGRIKGRLTEMLGSGAIGIDVDVYQGEVTLQGRVRSPNMENRVLAVAARTPGVVKVNNLLRIIP
ncbi:MAG: BON domain-containing protein [Deltaproteobacteria bacterium]|nr:BON domain-containing protein [Deltaproteobacteria bacterium]